MLSVIALEMFPRSSSADSQVDGYRSSKGLTQAEESQREQWHDDKVEPAAPLVFKASKPWEQPA